MKIEIMDALYELGKCQKAFNYLHEDYLKLKQFVENVSNQDMGLSPIAREATDILNKLIRADIERG